MFLSSLILSTNDIVCLCKQSHEPKLSNKCLRSLYTEANRYDKSVLAKKGLSHIDDCYGNKYDELQHTPTNQSIEVEQ